jgi:hypothetical protein
MLKAFAKVFDGYGSFFGLRHPASRLLLFACTMLHPATGLSGLECAALVIVTRKMLSFPDAGGEIEIVNGLLFGMLIGSLYQPSLASITVLALGAVLIVLATVCPAHRQSMETTSARSTLCFNQLPNVADCSHRMAAFTVPPFKVPPFTPLPMPLLGQSHLFNNLEFRLDWHSWLVAPTGESVLNLFAPLGSLYFNGTPIGGLIVFIAFAISSRYLAALALAASITCTVFLQLFCTTIYPAAFNGSLDSNLSTALSSTTGNYHPSILAVTTLPILIAQMNGVLTAGIIGGLYTVPSIRSIAVALGSGLLACLLTLFLENTFWSS